MPARLVAVSLAVWSPFAVERLWDRAVDRAAGIRRRAVAGVLLRRPRLSPWLAVLAPLGCLSASAGIVTGLVLLVVGATTGDAGADPDNWLLRDSLPSRGNAPWLVDGAAPRRGRLTARDARRSSPSRGRIGPGALGRPGDGWDLESDVVPGSRTGPARGLDRPGGVRGLALSGPAPVVRDRARGPAGWRVLAGVGYGSPLAGLVRPAAAEWVRHPRPGGRGAPGRNPVPGPVHADAGSAPCQRRGEALATPRRHALPATASVRPP